MATCSFRSCDALVIICWSFVWMFDLNDYVFVIYIIYI